MSASGEIYFIGEKDLRTKEITSYYKVGLVRENVENADRNSTQRLLEHQTRNPRELYIESVVKTDLVELVETLLHKNFAPLGVRGEWMLLNATQLSEVQKSAQQLAIEAKEITADLQKAEELAKVASSDELIPSTPELLALNEVYLESNAKLKACDEMFDAIKDIFAEALQDEDEVEEVGVFAQIQERQRSIFDEEAFKSAHSAIYAQFVVTKATIKGTPSFSGSKAFKKDFKDFDPGFASMVDGFTSIVEKIELGQEKKEYLHNYVYQYLSAEQGKTLAQVKIGLLEVLPFKHSSRDEAEVMNLVDAIIDASTDGKTLEVEKLQQKIDEKVFQIMGISEEVRVTLLL